MNDRPSQLHILVAPLDWGLGHTARCVPIIRHLIARGCRVTAAGEDWQRSFFEQTFPGEVASGALLLRPLGGYNVRYAKTSGGFLPRIFRQVPRLLRTVRAERQWLQALVEEEKVDGVISDNRYGLHHPRVPSVVLTHQVAPLSGLGGTVDALLRRIHYRALEKFGVCWMVDVAGAPALSGTLAHPSTLPRNGRYIGLLSQFPAEGTASSADAGPLLVLLSGPEPQRTLLAKKLWAQVQQHDGPVVFVEGKETARIPEAIPPHVTHYRRLTSQTLKPLLEAASTIICRSGYSTLMDLAALRKQAVIIPTPGQTEQEYLARMLGERGIFATARQEDFSLEDALVQLRNLPRREQEFSAQDFQVFRAVLDEWLADLGG